MVGFHFGQPVMLQLGTFQFGIATAAYQELARSTEYRWAEQELFGKIPVLQFTGPGADTIELPGIIYPEFRGGFGQVDAMRALAATGAPQAMVGATGENLGRWVIERVDDRGSVFADQGKARRVEFTLSLRRFPDEPAAATGVAAIAGGAVAVPAGATGVAGKLSGLAGSVSSAAKSLSGTLSTAAAAVQKTVAPIAAMGKDAVGGVLRAISVVSELQTTANRILAVAGVGQIDVMAIASAQNLATKAAGLVVSAESAGALLRNASDRMTKLGTVPAGATAAMVSATAAADSAAALCRQTAAQAATIKG